MNNMPTSVVIKEDAVRVLRREHAWVVRMVKKVWDWQAEQLADDEDACSVILEQLNKRAK